MPEFASEGGMDAFGYEEWPTDAVLPKHSADGSVDGYADTGIVQQYETLPGDNSPAGPHADVLSAPEVNYIHESMDQPLVTPKEQDYSDFMLSPEQRESLNSVDLRLYFGRHAYPDAIEDHGRVELAVDDRDFAGIESIVQQLDPANGDVFAREAHGFDTQWDIKKWTEVVLEWELAGSPYMQRDDQAALIRMLDGPLDADARSAFMHTIDKFRALWLINPIDYGSVLADMKQVPVYYADAQKTEENNWYKSAESSIKTSPKLVRPLLALRLGKEYDAFRNTRIVTALASIAKTMQPAQGAKPVLSYPVGSAHRNPIEKILDRGDVAYASHSFSPDLRNKHRGDTLRDIGHLILRKVDSSNERYMKLWIENARKNAP